MTRDEFERSLLDAIASVCVQLRVPATPLDPEINALIAQERDRFADRMSVDPE